MTPAGRRRRRYRVGERTQDVVCGSYIPIPLLFFLRIVDENSFVGNHEGDGGPILHHDPWYES